MGGLELSQINALERQFLFAIEFNLFVRPEDYARGVRDLHSAFGSIAAEWTAQALDAAVDVPPGVAAGPTAAGPPTPLHDAAAHPGPARDTEPAAVVCGRLMLPPYDWSGAPLDSERGPPSALRPDPTAETWTDAAVTAGRDVAGAAGALAALAARGPTQSRGPGRDDARARGCSAGSALTRVCAPVS